ncbi:MAG: glycosyl transferase, partial [Mesorhizobium sp.]
AGFPGLGAISVTLPSVTSGDEGFSGLVDLQGKPIDDDFKKRRSEMLLQAFRDCRPDIVIVEAFPFGRRQMRFELLPLIEAIDAASPRPLLVTSVRD